MSYINQIVEDGVTYDIAAKNLVNGFTQTTAGVNALDAAAGKSLNDSLANFQTEVASDYALKTDLTNIVRVGAVEETLQLESGASTSSGSVAIPTVSGYTAISVLDHNVSGSGSTGCYVYGTWLRNSTTIGYKAKNAGTGAATLTLSFKVLYMKTAFIS